MRWRVSLKVLCQVGYISKSIITEQPKVFLDVSKLKNTSYNQPTHQSQNEDG